MSLPEDLVLQARYLPTMDVGRPRQANLRRASSAAYYALFHFLIGEAVQIVPAVPAGLRNRVSRAFQHGEMKQVCLPLSRGNPPQAAGILLTKPVTDDIVYVATTFIDLQEIRHLADYDLAARFYRAETEKNIGEAEAALAIWKRIRSTDEATVFLAALAFGARWSK